MNINIGAYHKEEIIFTQEQVIAFAAISGDKNPVHLSDEYASKTQFKRKIIHGFLSGSIFSKIIGMDFPGEGSIFMKHELIFKKPMFVYLPYVAKVQISGIDIGKKRISLETVIFSKFDNEIAVTGSALVYYPNLMHV